MATGDPFANFANDLALESAKVTSGAIEQWSSQLGVTPAEWLTMFDCRIEYRFEGEATMRIVAVAMPKGPGPAND